MDKYESKLRIEEIEKLKKKKQYKEAARLADTIEWYRVKNAVTLYKIADLYKICRNYSKCRELLELAYERSPYAKNVIFALCDVCLEFGDFEAATEYYKEYVSLAPNDSGVWILKYKMLKALDAGIDEQIGILETLKRKDRIEEWEYELATLYHRAGLSEKCVEECDEIILWFGEGSYVYKAMELKMLHEPLTDEQQAVYNRRGERKAELAAKREARQTGRMKKIRLAEDDDRRAAREERTAAYVQKEAPAKEEEEEFHVKTINMGKFNTIDLQAELAANVQGYIGGEPSMINHVNANETVVANEAGALTDAPTRRMDQFSAYSATGQTSGPMPVEQIYPETSDMEELTAPETAPLNGTAAFMKSDIPADSEEVFFEDVTQDMRYNVSLPERSKGDDTKLKAFKERYSKEMEGKPLPEGMGRLYGEEQVSFETAPIAGGIVEEKVLEDGTVELIKQFNEDYEPEVIKVGKDRRPEKARHAERKPAPRTEYEAPDVEIQDPDYVNMMPTSEDKQISGQLNITDILAGWEEKKRETERMFQAELRKKTLENTGNLFADFDKEANSGLLATLENPALINSVTEQSSAKDFIKGVSVEDIKKGKKPARPEPEGLAYEELKIGKVIEAPLEEEPEAVEDEPLVDVSSDEAKEVSEEITEAANETTDVVANEVSAVSEDVTEETAEATEAGETEGSTSAEEAEVDSDEQMIRDILDQDEKEAKEALEKAKEPESLYYGSVTASISGNIWDEVDNVQPVNVAGPAEEAVQKTEEEVIGQPAEEASEVENEVNETVAEEPARVTPDLGIRAASVTELAAAAVEEATEETQEAEEVQEETQSNEEETKEDDTENKTTDVVEKKERRVKKKKRPENREKEASAPSENTTDLKETFTEAEKENASGANGNDLSKDAKRFFSPFLYSKKMKQQIMDAVENISLAAYTGNLIITADSSESSSKLATIFYQYLKASDPNFTGKAAKIGAEKLNKKDMGEIFEKLVGGALIVSHAGKMTNSTINAILQNLNQDARGVEVILHDTRSEIRRLLERASVLERFFNCRVDIIAVSAEMLAEYGKKYAEEKGYSVDDLAMLAFSGRISELQIGTHMVSVDEVKEIVDNAIEHADKPSPDKAFRTMTGKRYDEEHRVILREKDFEYRKK